MILHLFNEEKIVSRVISYFNEASKESNKFVVLIPNENYDLKYVTPSKDIDFLVYGTKLFWTTIGDVNQYSEILLHYLDITKAKFVNSISHSAITWIEWGADLYNQLLEPRGFKLYDEPDFLNKAGLLTTKGKLLKVFGIKGNIFKRQEIQNAIKKINFFVGLNFELDLLLEYYPEFNHLKRKYFFYYPIDDLIDEDLINESLPFTGDIILGNSSSPTGNHTSVLKYLSTIDLGDKKVTIPLSYGNNTLKKHVISKAFDLIPKNVVILEDFIPLNEYYLMLSRCSNFIYGNLRQEAVGNILVALFLGKKVFLHNNNPLFDFFRNQGITIYTIDEFQKEMNSPLAQKEISNNKQLISADYNKERLFSLIKSQFGEESSN